MYLLIYNNTQANKLNSTGSSEWSLVNLGPTTNLNDHIE